MRQNYCGKLEPELKVLLLQLPLFLFSSKITIKKVFNKQQTVAEDPSKAAIQPGCDRR